MTPVEELERRLLPLLEIARERLASRYPAYRFGIWSQPIGSGTPYQVHYVALEALMPDAHPDQADTVALSVGLMHLTTVPLLAHAGVDWGAGESPDIAVDLVAEPVLYTADALTMVEGEFPRLTAVFEQAVAAWRRRTSG